MDILLIIAGILAILAGIAGSLLPFLPGPPLAWVGLLLLHFSSQEAISTKMLLITAAVTLVIVLMDFLLPVWGAQRWGGTRAGQWGATLGIIAGFFLGPWGILLGPLIGAFLGEFIAGGGGRHKATRAALGSFTGFLLGTGIKLIWCVMMGWWFVRALLS